MLAFSGTTPIAETFSSVKFTSIKTKFRITKDILLCNCYHIIKDYQSINLLKLYKIINNPK